jgi:DNA-binding PadR family transcriptional regulator
VLGFLAIEPASGYDLKLAARTSVSHFWAASDNQIYPMLDRLEQEGFVRSRRVNAAGRREKVVFRITKAGEVALDEWLREVPKPSTFRHPGLIRLFFAWRLADDEIASLVDQQRELLDEQLATFRQLRQEVAALSTDAPESYDRRARLITLVLEFGLEMREAELRWWDRVRRELLGS